MTDEPKRAYDYNSPEVQALTDKVYEDLDPGGYGWAMGDGPTPESVVASILNMGYVLVNLNEKVMIQDIIPPNSISQQKKKTMLEQLMAVPENKTSE